MASLKRTATSLRALALSSWAAAQRQAELAGAIPMTPASFVGYAISIADGDLELARAFVPDAGGAFWRQVHAELDQIATEEGLSPFKAAMSS